MSGTNTNSVDKILKIRYPTKKPVGQLDQKPGVLQKVFDK